MGNTTPSSLTYLVSTLLGVLAGGLILQFATRWLAGFKPKYLTALLAVFAGDLMALAIGLVVGFFIGIITKKADATGGELAFIMLGGFFAQAGVYTLIIRDSDKKPISYGKACLAALFQVVFAAAILALVLSATSINKNNQTSAIAENTPRQIQNVANEKQNDIDKITVFEVSLFTGPDVLYGTNYVSLTSLQGRVKNGSSKTITKMAVKLLIYDSNNNQIDTLPVEIIGGHTLFSSFAGIYSSRPIIGDTPKLAPGDTISPSIGQPSELEAGDVKPFTANIPVSSETRIPAGFKYSCVIDTNKIQFQP